MSEKVTGRGLSWKPFAHERRPQAFVAEFRVILIFKLLAMSRFSVFLHFWVSVSASPRVLVIVAGSRSRGGFRFRRRKYTTNYGKLPCADLRVLCFWPEISAKRLNHKKYYQLPEVILCWFARVLCVWPEMSAKRLDHKKYYQLPEVTLRCVACCVCGPK